MVMGREYSNRAKLADVILKGSATVRPTGQQYETHVVMEPTYPELYSALEALAYRATGKRGQKPDARLLGNYLRKFKGKIVDGRRFAMKADNKRGAEWWVEEVKAKPMVKAGGLNGWGVCGGLWGSLSRAWGENGGGF